MLQLLFVHISYEFCTVTLFDRLSFSLTVPIVWLNIKNGGEVDCNVRSVTTDLYYTFCSWREIEGSYQNLVIHIAAQRLGMQTNPMCNQH